MLSGAAFAIIRRTLSCCATLCFLLPFVAVQGCGSKTVERYTGMELFLRSSGWIWIIPLAAAVLLFGGSFIRRHWSPAALGALRAAAALIAALSFMILVWFPGLQFLFDRVRPLAGQIIGAAAWAFLYGYFVVRTIQSLRGIPLSAQSPNTKRWIIPAVIAAVTALILPLMPLPFADPLTISHVAQSMIVLLAFSLPGLALIRFLFAAAVEGKRWGKLLLIISTNILFAGVVFLMLQLLQ